MASTLDWLYTLKSHQAQATHHREEAARYAERAKDFQRDDPNDTRAQAMEAIADRHIEQARSYEAQESAMERGSGSPEQEREPVPNRRRWYEPGSVAESPLIQVAEAMEGSSLLTEGLKYATHSLRTRDGQAYQATKAVLARTVGRGDRHAAPAPGKEQRARQQGPDAAREVKERKAPQRSKAGREHER